MKQLFVVGLMVAGLAATPLAADTAKAIKIDMARHGVESQFTFDTISARLIVRQFIITGRDKKTLEPTYGSDSFAFMLSCQRNKASIYVAVGDLSEKSQTQTVSPFDISNIISGEGVETLPLEILDPMLSVSTSKITFGSSLNSRDIVRTATLLYNRGSLFVSYASSRVEDPGGFTALFMVSGSWTDAQARDIGMFKTTCQMLTH